MRTASPFAAPKPRKPPKVKRDTTDEAKERAYVRQRDPVCVARLIIMPGSGVPLSVMSPCNGPLTTDHVRASGGLGMKSPTVRTNLVRLCMGHHRLKTDWGKTWRPLLLAYLAIAESDDE